MRLASAASARRAIAWSPRVSAENQPSGSLGNGHDAGHKELSLGQCVNYVKDQDARVSLKCHTA